MGLGELLRSYWYWRSWRSWGVKGRQQQIQAIERELNAIQVEAPVVVMPEQVEIIPPDRPYAPSEADLYQKEKQTGKQESYW
tara:strand:- start:753 stop:998 length:246 start_codon:yes stop_codon:yes gene_type:complete